MCVISLVSFLSCETLIDHENGRKKEQVRKKGRGERERVRGREGKKNREVGREAERERERERERGEGQRERERQAGRVWRAEGRGESVFYSHSRQRQPRLRALMYPSTLDGPFSWSSNKYLQQKPG